MKKILILISFLIFSVNLFAQVTKWDPVRKKQNFKDSVNFVKLPLLNINDSLSTRAYVRAVVGGGGLPGVLIQEDSSHLQNQVNYVTKYFLKSGYVPITTTVNGHALSGNITVTATDVSLGNVTNESKATMFTSPTFTGTVTIPTPFTIGVISVTANGTELNVLDNIPGTLTSTELGYVDGVTSAIQTQFTGKVAVADTATMLTKYARKASPTFTGTVVLPSTTNIGNISATEIGYIDDATSNIQLQINALLDSIATLRALIQVSEVPHVSQIHYVSTSGNDANSGMDTTHAWQTLAYAEAHATAAGDTIALKKGDNWASSYSVNITHSGANGYPITWDGSLWGAGADAIISANADHNDPKGAAIVCVTGCKYVTFQNITLDGNNNYCYGFVVGGDPSQNSEGYHQNDEQYITFQDCNIIDIGGGSDYCIGILIRTWYNTMSNITVRRNTLDGISSWGIAGYNGKLEDGAPSPGENSNLYIGYNNVTNCETADEDQGAMIGISAEVTDAIIEYNIITQGVSGHAVAGISVSGYEGFYPTGAIIRYNDVRMDNKPAFITENGYALGIDIYYNKFYADTPGQSAVWLFPPSVYTYAGASINFYNNTIVSNTGDTFYSEANGTATTTFKNNIVINTAQSDAACVVINNPTSFVHNNNSYYKSGTGDLRYVVSGSTYYRTTVQNWEATCIKVDPTLVDLAGFNWHLQASSPLKTAGVTIAGIPLFDYEGNAVSPTTPSIGAYEYH